MIKGKGCGIFAAVQFMRLHQSTCGLFQKHCSDGCLPVLYHLIGLELVSRIEKIKSTGTPLYFDGPASGVVDDALPPIFIIYLAQLAQVLPTL